MFYIAVFFILIFVCYKFSDWKNWKLYYPTILYFIIGDLTFHVLSDPKWLWAYQAWPFTIHFTWLYVVTSIYPCLIILYLTYIPKKVKFIVLYMILCVVTFTLCEYIITLLGVFHYYNGWNLKLSALFDCIMFPMIYLHYKKPLLAWPISAAFAMGFMFLFKIPF